MALTATNSAPPPDVAQVMAACPPAAANALSCLRDLIFETASALPEAGSIRETLKWGQPSFLTEAPRSGTTIRLGWDDAGEHISLFVHCQTTLIDAWRERYSAPLVFVGNRELRIPLNQPFPRAALRHCIAMALTYHSRKMKP
ncbi:MAG: DUF1801 domain-containing protein [Pseudomonadota bacterium]